MNYYDYWLESIKGTFSKTLKFRGRTSWNDFWIFWIGFYVPFVYIIYIIEIELFWFDPETLQGNIRPFIGYLLIPVTLPLGVRRLHDVGRSGWWVLGLNILILLTFNILSDLNIDYIENTAGDWIYNGLYAYLYDLVITHFIIIGISMWPWFFFVRKGDGIPNKYDL